MNDLPGEDWKEASVSRRDVVRYIKMKDRLLAMLPWYQCPVEVYCIAEVNNGDYIKVASSMLGQQWIKRSQLNVVAILPTPPKPPKGPLTATQIREGMKDYTPPWIDGLGDGK